MGGPLLLFWLAGALAVVWRRGSGKGLCRLPERHTEVLCTIAAQRPLGPILWAAAATAVIVMSAWALSASAAFALEILAGRWGTSKIALAYTRHRIARHRARRSDLATWRQAPPAGLNRENLDAWHSQNGWRATRRRAAYARYPRMTDSHHLLPTSVGNALVSVSAEARRTYGLDLAVCWDPFVKALDAPVRSELTVAATRVFARVQGLVCAAGAALWAAVIPECYRGCYGWRYAYCSSGARTVLFGLASTRTAVTWPASSLFIVCGSTGRWDLLRRRPRRPRRTAARP